jgi:hypothetical protein
MKNKYGESSVHPSLKVLAAAMSNNGIYMSWQPGGDMPHLVPNIGMEAVSSEAIFMFDDNALQDEISHQSPDIRSKLEAALGQKFSGAEAPKQAASMEPTPTERHAMRVGRTSLGGGKVPKAKDPKAEEERLKFDLLESFFHAGNYDEVIRSGRAFIREYPSSGRVTSVRSLMNAARMRTGRPAVSARRPSSP